MSRSSIAARGAVLSVVAAALLITSAASAQTTPPSGTVPQGADQPADQASPANTTPGTAPPEGVPPEGVPPEGVPPEGVPPEGVPPEDDAPAGDPTAASEGDAATGDMPVNLRLRRLEQQVQALKERAWRAKARVGMLKEAVLGGGVGAQATIVHEDKMGSSFRLEKLVYALDGTQIFARNDESGNLHKQESFEILTGPIAPGSHTLSVLAVYRGHGYGVFSYLNKYKFTVRSSHTFTASEGKSTRIEVVGFEKGGVTTPLEKRPAIDFKVSNSQGPGN